MTRSPGLFQPDDRLGYDPSTLINISLPDGMYVSSREVEIDMIRFGHTLMSIAIGIAILLALYIAR